MSIDTFSSLYLTWICPEKNIDSIYDKLQLVDKKKVS